MAANEWEFLNAEALNDVIDRLGKEAFGKNWPSPPTEDSVRAEAARRLEIIDNDPTPAVFPGSRQWKRSVEEFIGPDPRRIAPTPVDSILSPFQHNARSHIIEDLYERYYSQRSGLGKKIISKIQDELYKGTKKAIIIKSDGAKPVRSDWWSGSNARQAIEDGEFRGCVILLRVDEANSSTPSKNNNISKCQKWLENLRRENPDGYPSEFATKDHFEEEAIRKFKGLTEYGFKSAWTKAAKAVPLSPTSGWGRHGVKKKTKIK